MSFVTCFECATHDVCRTARKCGQGNGLPLRLKMKAPVENREPIAVSAPYRMRQGKVVRDALEAAALAEPDPVIRADLLRVARSAHTETLAYIARLLKG